uniref:Transposase Tc1-like domain-containing protein n=1 Tax=Cyprinus carpio carpio TaxID=630221 RepID=A0A9J7XQI9_CYPCA
MVSQFGSPGYTITGKTADLTVVQKTIIDTLHKEGKPQTFIAKEAGCSQSAVSKHVNRKLSGRKKCGRKRCTANRENHSLMRIVKQNRFKNLSELHKEWTEAGVKASRATTHRHVKEFGYSCRIPLDKPLLNHRQRQSCLTWRREEFNAIQVYLYSAFYDTNHCKGTLQKIKFLQYLVVAYQ